MQYFANVIGSGSDKIRGGGLWISLWVKYANGDTPIFVCSTDGCFYDSSDIINEKKLTRIIFPFGNQDEDKPNAVIRNAECCGCMVGGHIILNAKAAGSVAVDGNVYIIPICTAHNISHTGGNGWGVGFYMKLRDSVNALKLVGYLRNISKYLE